MNYDVFGTEEYTTAAEAPAGGSKKYLKTLDYNRLKKDHGIEKFKFEVSPADSDGYLFDFLPFPATKSHPRYQALLAAFKGEDPADWKMNITLHRIKTPSGEQKYLCPQKNFGKPCPACEEKSRLFDEIGTWDKNADKSSEKGRLQAQIKALNDTARDFFLIRNRADGNVYVMEYSTFFFGDNLKSKLSRSNRGAGQIILPKPGPKGTSLRFWVDPSTATDNKGNPIIGPIKQMEFETREEAIPADILESLPALDEYLVEYSYDDIAAVLDGTYFLGGDEETTVTSEPAESPAEQAPVADAPTQGSDSLTREERRAKRQREKEAAAGPTCPAGGTFGTDIDSFDDCDDCALYEKCEATYKSTVF